VSRSHRIEGGDSIFLQYLPVAADCQYTVSPALIGALLLSGLVTMNWLCAALVSPSEGQVMGLVGSSTRQLPLPKTV
jgi:hypothetical protein